MDKYLVVTTFFRYMLGDIDLIFGNNELPINIKSISQSIAKKSGRNCFISELWTSVTLYVPAT
jgi:hypothetical protein